MAIQMGKVLAFSAVSGMVAALAGCGGSEPAAGTPTSGVAAQPASPAKHACKGQNACKGQGGCKTDKNACKGQNGCKGQGGCKTA
jgi:hypothetical protein